MIAKLRYLLLILPVLFLLFLLDTRAFSEDQIPGTPYVMRHQGLLTLKFTPKEKTLEFFATGKPLLRLKPSELTVLARESTASEDALTKLTTSGDRFLLPEAFTGKTIELKVQNAGNKPEKFILEILPKN